MRPAALAALLLAASVAVAGAQPLWLQEWRDEGPTRRSTSADLPFLVTAPSPRLAIQVVLNSTKVLARFTLLAQDGTVQSDMTPGARPGLPTVVATTGATGTYRLKVWLQRISGPWGVRVFTVPSPADLRPFFLSPALMAVVGVLAVVAWRRATGAPSWAFLAGAALWALGVGLKFAWEGTLNERSLLALRRAVPTSYYLALGSLYVGLLTGVFEVVLVWLAARRRPALAASAAVAGAVGVGAGAAEAVALAVAALGTAAAAASDAPAGVGVAAALGAASVVTPWAWLAAPVERALTLPCHVAARLLALQGARSSRLGLVVPGVLLLTLVDALVGAWHLSGVGARHPLWWLEGALAAVAVAGTAAAYRSSRRWPA